MGIGWTGYWLSTHSKTDHLDREGEFSGAKLVRTFKKFLKKYKNKIPEIPRKPPDDIAIDYTHYIYDKESNYTIIFFIKDGSPDVFLVLTAYPDTPQRVGKMTKWEVWWI